MKNRMCTPGLHAYQFFISSVGATDWLLMFKSLICVLLFGLWIWRRIERYWRNEALASSERSSTKPLPTPTAKAGSAQTARSPFFSFFVPLPHSPRGRLPHSHQSRARSCTSLAPVSQLLREKKGTAYSPDSAQPHEELSTYSDFSVGQSGFHTDWSPGGWSRYIRHLSTDLGPIQLHHQRLVD